MSADDGSSAPTLMVNGWPTVAVSDPVITDTGAVLITLRVAVAVAVSALNVTRSATWRVAGPSSIPSASRLAQAIVGETPVASSNCPSPSRSHSYTAPAEDAEPSSDSGAPSATVYGPPPSATGVTGGATESTTWLTLPELIAKLGVPE